MKFNFNSVKIQFQFSENSISIQWKFNFNSMKIQIQFNENSILMQRNSFNEEIDSISIQRKYI